MSLAQTIEKFRNKGDMMPDIKGFIIAVADDIVQRRMEEALKGIEPEIEDEVEKQIKAFIKANPQFKGPAGSQGPQGPAGDDGHDGIDGNDGKPGKDGKPGQNGIDGKDGNDGQNGKDGSPDTPDQVVEKVINSKRKLPRSKIEGLEEEFKKLGRAVGQRAGARPSGGGMGNVQHESKALSSSTTSITVNNPIAGGGYAIWFYYQGQFMARGVHYTVGSDRKTLTLLFTPQDSTAADLVYIRG